MFNASGDSASRREFQKGIDTDENRRRRQDDRLSLRKKQRQAHINKRRRQLHGGSNRARGGMGSDSPRQQQQIPPWVKLENLQRFVRQVYDNDFEQVFEGVRAIRQLLSVENTPPIEETFQFNVLPKLLEIMTMKVNVKDAKHKTPLEEKRCKLQFEAAWAITNVASGEREYTVRLCRLGAIDAFMKLLQNTVDVETADQAIWGLGNIAGDCAQLRDAVLQTGVLEYILENLFNFPLSMQRNAVWTLSNFCRAKPAPKWDRVSKILGPITKLLTQTKDYDVIVDILWALSFLSEDRGDTEEQQNAYQVDAVIQTGVVHYVVHLVRHAYQMGEEAWNMISRERALAQQGQREPRIPRSCQSQLNTSDYVIAPCVRIMGNIVSGSDEQTQSVVEAGFFDIIQLCVAHRVKNIRKESCWALSNVVAGTQKQLEEFFGREQLVERVVKLALEGDLNVRKEAGWCLSNAVCGATFDQVRTLVNFGFIEAMAKMLELHSVEKVLFMAMEALDGCISAYNKHFSRPMDDYNEFAEKLEELGGIDRLEEIQQLKHVSDKCAELAESLILKYFGEDSNPQDADMPSFGSNYKEGRFGFDNFDNRNGSNNVFQF